MMNLNSKVAIFILFTSGILSVASTGLTADGYHIPASSIEMISEHDICYRVTNNNSQGIFVPTKSLTEWQGFINNAPQNISLGPCSYDSCLEAYETGNTEDGFYDINVASKGVVESRECLMSVHGGGWTRVGRYTANAISGSWHTIDMPYKEILLWRASGTIRGHCPHPYPLWSLALMFFIGSDGVYYKDPGSDVTRMPFGNKNIERKYYNLWVGDGELIHMRGSYPLEDNCGSASADVFVR